jgi:hypothetical protein
VPPPTRKRHDGFLGVYREPRGTRGPPAIRIEARRVSLGCLVDAREAAVARDRVRRSIGAWAHLLNLPTRRPRPATIEQMRAPGRTKLKARRTGRYLVVYSAGRNAVCPWDVQTKRCIRLGRWPTERDAARAYDRDHGGTRNLGTFEDQDDAARAYDDVAVVRRFGARAVVNFDLSTGHVLFGKRVSRRTRSP